MLAINQAQTGKGGEGGRVLVAKNQLQCKQKALCQPVATWVMMSQRKLAQLDMLYNVCFKYIMCIYRYIYIHDLCMFLYVYMYLVIKLQLIIVSLENLTKFTLIYGWSICWGISATADVQVKS